jgi:hypothetical protein
MVSHSTVPNARIDAVFKNGAPGSVMAGTSSPFFVRNIKLSITIWTATMVDGRRTGAFTVLHCGGMQHCFMGGGLILEDHTESDNKKIIHHNIYEEICIKTCR